MNYDSQNIGIIAAIYQQSGDFGQLFTGRMSDLYSKRKCCFGNVTAGYCDSIYSVCTEFYQLASISAVLGLGSILLFLSAIAQATTPHQRAESIGTFRLWRDLGYAIGAIISGITADLFGVNYAIILIGLITIVSSVIIEIRMPKDN
jgi:MFS family permease